MYEDKTLVCRDCGQEFVFTAGAPRETYTTTCANCGAETTVPFIPKNDRPIYCSECFAAMRR